MLGRFVASLGASLYHKDIFADCTTRIAKLNHVSRVRRAAADTREAPAVEDMVVVVVVVAMEPVPVPEPEPVDAKSTSRTFVPPDSSFSLFLSAADQILTDFYSYLIQLDGKI